MNTFLISDSSEIDRVSNVNSIQQIPFLKVSLVAAIYPSKIRVPFFEKLVEKSKERSGNKLLSGEIGCLLSHRKIWRQISKEEDPQRHFLILESDSMINNINALQHFSSSCQSYYDIFFWGSWNGHSKLFRSSKIRTNYTIGTAFIKSVYCTYGYSLNSKAARLLLERTSKISYPVDQFKRFFTQSELRLGAILPEVISGNEMGSTIRSESNQLSNKLFLFLLDIKNSFICFFK